MTHRATEEAGHAAADTTRDASAIEVVESFLAALERLDLDAAEALLAEDAVYQNVPLPADHGKARVMGTLRRMMRLVDEVEIRTHRIGAQDGVVLTERTDVLRGKALDLEFWVCGTFEVRDGEITLWRDYFDVLTFAWQVVTSPARKLLRRR